MGSTIASSPSRGKRLSILSRGMTVSHTQLPRGTLTSPPNRGTRPREVTLGLKLRGIQVHRGTDSTPGDGAATLAPPHDSQLNRTTLFNSLVTAHGRGRQTQRRKWTLGSARDGYP